MFIGIYPCLRLFNLLVYNCRILLWFLYFISISCYFFFFISNAGTAYLGKVSNQTWTVCGETPIPGYNARGIYTLEVARDKSNSGYDVIRCYVNGELYVSYKDSNHVDGTVYGVRAGKAGIQFSGIEISSEIKGASVAVEGYVIASGEYEQKGDMLTSLTGNAIAEKIDGEFIYGSLEATMKIGGAADNGLIFSLTANDTHAYWEADVSYYFFFVSKDGFAFLGKVDNGTWANCQLVDIPGYTTNKSYTLKIEKDATTIYGYVDGNCLITYADSFPLTGTGYGLRAGGSGVSFSNIKCQSSGEITEIYPEDLTVVSGKMLGTNGAARSADNNTLALMKDASMEEGTLTANIKGVATKRAGLVFGYSNDGTTESYYRFVSRKDAQKVELDMVVNGVASNVYSNYLSAGYNSGRGYDFRVVIEEGVAYCYFWNTLYAVVDVELAGTGVGLYAESAGSQFAGYTVSAEPSVTKVDTLLFGHSYFELWSNYKNDLAQLAKDYEFGTYLNIGIGGSVASHWAKFKKALVAYDASKAIYMIGINDLTGGTSPAAVVASIEEALDKFFINKSFNSENISVKGAIRLILDIGGIPVLAHPSRVEIEFNELIKKIREWKGLGLAGIEAIYSLNSEEENELYLNLAKQLGLGITIGSDYHGEHVKANIKLGSGVDGSMRMYIGFSKSVELFLEIN